MGEVESGKSNFPSVGGAVAWIFVFVAVQILCSYVAAKLAFPNIRDFSLLMTKMLDFKAAGVINLYAMTASGLLITAMLLVHLRNREKRVSIGLFSPSQLGVAKTVAVSVALWVCATGVSFLYSRYVVPGTQLQSVTRNLIASIPTDFVHQLLLFLVITVFAAISEELIFRGLLQNALTKHLGSAWAIVLASTAFALVHFQLHALPVLILMGMTFGYLYQRTGSLLVNVVVHSLNNAAALLMT